MSESPRSTDIARGRRHSWPDVVPGRTSAGRSGRTSAVLKELLLRGRAPVAWVLLVAFTGTWAMTGLAAPASATDPIIDRAISELRAEMAATDLGTLETPLESLLEGAVRDLERGDETAAADKLASYVELVSAQTGKKLAVTVATELANQATQIIGVLAAPSMTIGWATLQWPPTAVVEPGSPVDVYGQVWIEAATSQVGPVAAIEAQLGVGAPGTAVNSESWAWVAAVFNTDVGDVDEYVAELDCTHLSSADEFAYVYRFRVYGSSTYFYADLDGPIAADGVPTNPGVLAAYC